MLDTIYHGVIMGDAPRVAEGVRQALEAGHDPVKILNRAMIAAMAEVGRRFEAQEYFLPEMLIADRPKALLEAAPDPPYPKGVGQQDALGFCRVEEVPRSCRDGRQEGGRVANTRFGMTISNSVLELSGASDLRSWRGRTSGARSPSPVQVCLLVEFLGSGAQSPGKQCVTRSGGGRAGGEHSNRGRNISFWQDWLTYSSSQVPE